VEYGQFMAVKKFDAATNRPNTRSRPFRKTFPSAGWSASPSCAGASSATIRSSSKSSGLGILKGRGFHHHAMLCIAAYGFLISERETIPPSGPRSATLFPQLAVSCDTVRLIASSTIFTHFILKCLERPWGGRVGFRTVPFETACDTGFCHNPAKVSAVVQRR
jgi:hypothetical protein